jgi:type I restriction enzyme S subunit
MEKLSRYRQDLPADWTIELLDNLAKRGSGHTPNKKKANYWNGGIKWVSLADSSKLDNLYISETAKEISEDGISHSSAVKHPPGIVVLSRDAGVGKSAITTCEMAVSQHFIRWECGPRLNNHFLYYWFQFVKPEFEHIAVGSTIKTIGLPYFKKLRILCPPRPTQDQIVAILIEWDKAITLMEQLIEAQRRQKKALMQQLLTGRRRFKKFEGQPWHTAYFGQVFNAKQVENCDSKVNNPITVGKYTIRKQSEHFNRIVASKDVSNYYIIEPGDFVYDPMSAYYGAIGRYDLDEIGIVSPAYRVLSISEDYDSDFMKHFVKSYCVLRQLESHSTQGNRPGKRRGIQKQAFDRIRFEAPSLAEQRAIAEVLDACDYEVDLLTQKLDALRRQKKGLMQQLLTGRVRVKVA